MTIGMQWLYKELKTDPKSGISSSTIDSRLKAYGNNEMAVAPPAGFWRLFWEALHDLTLIILIVAALISIVVSTIVEEEHRSIGKKSFK